ncbi:hypothetical protein PS627_03465 [Pseudomonas fluorescens]|uniref:2-oxoadipate dioxygenase/decarboxylase HglS n=1 Tax=Pseudomonas fluorescens TaxID=294 RepID=UPI00125487DD|nr:VOC family protein [Pseudomonas fluorescens]CAG8869393.1 hypothetical protein PS627_03465 [Pseudomonas fluorescens]VVP72257.1 hypothetical protein PS910_01044 [Pseudomonas fluorescens]
MPAHDFVSPDSIRAQFSAAMSLMYKQEVPLYGTLLELVSEINQQVMAQQPEIARALRWTGEIERLDQERHGAIRVGTAEELATIARLFAVMGMQPVGYYDLSSAGVPVHSTAFRAVHEQSLHISPFRVFTSLLRLELIDNPQLRELAGEILAKRQIFTPTALELIFQHEREGGLNAADAQRFVAEALQTFRWHQDATVTAAQYRQLHDQHRLIADVVAFRGPHINHLTPRTLDIDAIQQSMPARNIPPKAVVEGPPARRHPILLRQTSFKALQEKVAFSDQQAGAGGSHTARFGEIEQRGAALTPKGRALYDQLLDAARVSLGGAPSEANAEHYNMLLEEHFAAFPDDLAQMREQGLAYFRYFATDKGLAARELAERPDSLQALIDAGHVHYEALVYEDFLPVSAAGIFQSNLGDEAHDYGSNANRDAFEQALGLKVQDELALYAQSEQRSLQSCAQALDLSFA